METTFQEPELKLESIKEVLEEVRQRLAEVKLRLPFNRIAELSFDKIGELSAINQSDKAEVTAYRQRYRDYIYLSSELYGIHRNLCEMEKKIVNQERLQKGHSEIESWYQKEVEEGRYPLIEDVGQRYTQVLIDCAQDNPFSLLEMLAETMEGAQSIPGIIIRVGVIRRPDLQQMEEDINKAHAEFLEAEKSGQADNFEPFIKDLIISAFDEVPKLIKGTNEEEYIEQVRIYFRLVHECIEKQEYIDILILAVNEVGDEDQKRSLRDNLDKINERYKTLKAKKNSKRCITVSKISNMLNMRILANSKYTKLLYKFAESQEI